MNISLTITTVTSLNMSKADQHLKTASVGNCDSCSTLKLPVSTSIT